MTDPEWSAHLDAQEGSYSWRRKELEPSEMAAFEKAAEDNKPLPGDNLATYLERLCQIARGRQPGEEG